MSLGKQLGGLTLAWGLGVMGCGAEDLVRDGLSDMGAADATDFGNNAPGTDFNGTNDAGTAMPFFGDAGTGIGKGDGGAVTEACAAVTEEAVDIEVEVEVPYEVTETIETPVPTVIYIMLDRSGSMNGTRWDNAEAAIRGFVNDPNSAGFKVALNYFTSGPLEFLFGGCGDDRFKAPAVAVGELPAHAAAINASLDATDAAGGGGTPIEPALRGMTDFCIEYEQANPGENCVGVFITDGQPSACAGDAPTLGGIVATANDAANGAIKSFAIGMDGADFSLLDAIALNGGTSTSINVSQGGALLTTLENIRETVAEVTTRTETRTETRTQKSKLDCEWSIPPSPDGESFDKDRVNVELTLDGADPESLGRVDSVDGCADVDDAWHYDDADDPTTILVCPDTCDLIKADEDARVDVALGCETQIAAPE